MSFSVFFSLCRYLDRYPLCALCPPVTLTLVGYGTSCLANNTAVNVAANDLSSTWQECDPLIGASVTSLANLTTYAPAGNATTEKLLCRWIRVRVCGRRKNTA